MKFIIETPRKIGQFSEDFGFDVLLGMDGPHGSLGGKITLTMGNFFDILVERGIVSPGSE